MGSVGFYCLLLQYFKKEGQKSKCQILCKQATDIVSNVIGYIKQEEENGRPDVGKCQERTAGACGVRMTTAQRIGDEEKYSLNT
jgi:hypothetical protein